MLIDFQSTHVDIDAPSLVMFLAGAKQGLRYEGSNRFCDQINGGFLK